MKKQATIEKKAGFGPILWVILCCLAMTASVGQAKSLYLAGDSPIDGQDALWVYDVQPDGKLVFQTTTTFPHGGGDGVNGLSVDADSDTILITFNSFHNAVILDSQTLAWEKFIYLVPQDFYAAGMTYDAERSRVYATDEANARLIVYNWVPELQALHNIGYGASEVLLSKASAGAIAYDPDLERVYVASANQGIEVLKTAFNREDWKKIGSLQSAYEAMALSVDARNQYLYVGGSGAGGATITRYNLATDVQTPMIVGSTSEAVLALCVDNATSFVYALIGNIHTSTRTLKVYGPGLNTVQTLTHAGDALRLYVPSTSVGYNPLSTTITPISGVVQNDGKYIAVPGAEVTYRVCMTNNNLFPVTDIILTDPLPQALNFVRATNLGNAVGVYDQLSRTYVFHNPVLAPDSTQCFEIVTKVKHDVLFDTVVTNAVAVDSNETVQSGASADIEIGYSPFELTKNVVMDPNYLTVGNTIYVGAGDYVTYQICMSNLTNNNPVTNVLLIDQLPEYVDFVSAEQGGLISHYDSASHSYSWAFNLIEPNYLDCFDITVRIRDDVPPGQLISNEVLVGGSETSTVTTTTDIVVKYDALAVNVGIRNTADYDPATNQIFAGGVLTYTIDVNNSDPLYSADNLVIIDSVPAGLQFIGSDANGVYDSLSRTFTLELPYLGPGQGIHVELSFLVNESLQGGSVLKNTVIAMANGAPASSDSVSVSVFKPGSGVVQTTLELYYTGPLLRTDHADDIMAVMKLPGTIRMSDINTAQALVMTPGLSQAYHKDTVQGITTIYYMYTGVDGSLTVKGFFDRQSVLNTLLPGQKTVNITVTGRLKTGQSFVGQTTVSVN
jgi:uncharacterized repeat protein (TIGR01451 family)